MSEAASVPAGIVTCLFSDIEGSTRLELDIGTGAYRDILERHRVLLRAAFTRHGGHEQGTEGDSFFVIFGGADGAVAAAADAQRALVTEPWPDGLAVQVRMGLHTGQIESTGSDVIGLAINRAARIASAAHGGQVLLSETTRALVAEALPGGVALRDLGEHRLRDLRAPERLTQLVIDGVPDVFPPPRTLDVRPNNLPTQLTTFVGREREVREASALLGTTRLLTLTGPGGTGKTRLSLQIAAAASDRFVDGVWFVALEPIRDVNFVASTILHTMGVADGTARAPLDVLVDTVGERRILFVLDNFEQVVAAGPVVAELLRRCPSATCLVTSRIALHVSGEQEYPVDGLPAPPDTSRLSEVDRLNLPRELREFDLETLGTYEAVRLFIARAGAVRPGFAVTNANAPAVAAIVARLHGMPLAIELAAARIKLLSPDQILDRLEHHLTVLAAGSVDLPERQRTLRGAIAWSYDLLDDPSRRLLDRLSVFRGGCDLVMAETVCGGADELGIDPFDGLSGLVDQSLVRVDTTGEDPRFELLDTIAAYAGEMLDARGEAEATRELHARTMLALAEGAAPHLSGVEQRHWLDRLERDHDNLRAALEWAEERPDPAAAARLVFALWRFWQQRGYLNEARLRLEAIAAREWDLEPVLEARFAEALGGVAYWQSDYPAATRWYDRALSIWRDLGDRREIANALYNRAYANMVLVMGGDVSEATVHAGEQMMEEALAIYQELGDRRGEANLLWGLGSIRYFTADPATAETWYRRSLELHREVGDRTMEAWSLHMLALASAGQRHWEAARETARHALSHFHEAGDISGVILTVDDLALVALADGDEERAGRLWGAARHLQHLTGTTLADYVDQHQTLFGVPTPRDTMAPDVLERRSAEGAAMGLDELVAYALGAEGGTVPTSHAETS